MQLQPPTTLWLIRHASTGVAGRCCGWHDVYLSPEGIDQANEVAKRLQSGLISQVYSSTSTRAIETASILAEARKLEVRKMADLREIHFGDLEGLRFDEIEERFPQIFQSWMERPTDIQFPNGESFRQMSARVLRALEMLLSRHRGESFALVTHAGVIRVVLGSALGIPDGHIFRLAQQDAAVNRIRYWEGGPVVELING